ncbi:MAG TPA: ATP-binding protein, partial [Anaerolineales bacterium]|nr:ATP-binding protein [Anaerolineales bacterium]
MPETPPPSERNLNIGNQATIGGDVVGRDKIIYNLNIIQRTAAEEVAQTRDLERQRLAQGVSGFVQRLLAQAEKKAGSGGPYKGLLEYRLSDSELFFGRERAIRDLMQNLGRGPLTVLHSESGTGKTSLLQAGISPRLIGAGHLPLYLRPYNVEPLLAIKRAFISDPSQTPILAAAPLRDFLRQVSDVLGLQTTLYILIDQFEELFTQLSELERGEFIREL